VTDNLTLKGREYVISMKGVELARYELAHGCELAIHADDKAGKIEGLPTREPAFGIPAVWIAPENVDKARHAGYTIVDTISILGTHLGEGPPPRLRIALASGCQESAGSSRRR
jgi:flagellar biosynthesis protein FlhA